MARLGSNCSIRCSMDIKILLAYYRKWNAQSTSNDNDTNRSKTQINAHKCKLHCMLLASAVAKFSQDHVNRNSFHQWQNVQDDFLVDFPKSVSRTKFRTNSIESDKCHTTRWKTSGRFEAPLFPLRKTSYYQTEIDSSFILNPIIRTL